MYAHPVLDGQDISISTVQRIGLCTRPGLAAAMLFATMSIDKFAFAPSWFSSTSTYPYVSEPSNASQHLHEYSYQARKSHPLELAPIL